MTTLASAAGLSLPYISKRLAGQYVFTLFDIEQVAHALDMEPEGLMAAAVEEAAAMPADVGGEPASEAGEAGRRP